MRLGINTKQLVGERIERIEPALEKRALNGHPNLDNDPGASMSVTVETILASFNELGLRNTVQRAAIAGWLADASASGRDFSGEDLWHELRTESPRLGRATVFRALDTLERDGVLDRVELLNGSRRYRVCGGGHHHHIVCVVCGKVSDVRSCLSSQLAAAITDETGFILERHSFELFGRCGGCRETVVSCRL